VIFPTIKNMASEVTFGNQLSFTNFYLARALIPDIEDYIYCAVIPTDAAER